ncbi:MAG: hypothetical protein QM501_00925 [Gimesia sp.]
MKQIHSKINSHQNRRGIAILWLILWGSVFLTFFCGVLEIATLWQAQVEVKKALDAAALAAVKEWGDRGVNSTNIPRDVGVAYTVANPILGVAFTPTTNLGTVSVANPNANALNTGNFVFGAIDTTTDPITFNGNAVTSCAAGAVTIRISDNDNSGTVTPGSIRLSFDSGTNLAIDSVAFTLPTKTMGPANAFAYFDATSAPQVDTTGGTFNGLDVDPTSSTPDIWNCSNLNGDICFTFSNQLAPNRFQTVQIDFDGNSFTEFDFFHFGVSTNNLGPSGYPAPAPGSVGNAWGQYGVIAEVTFRNTISNVTSTASAVFVNVPAANTSEATLTGGGGGGFPAVIAQGTVPTQGFCSTLFGVSIFNVTSKSIAYYDCGTGRAALVSVDNIIFP